MDIVRITGLELDCIVGIRAYERDREQRVRLDLALGVETRRAGRSGRISETVDYDMVSEHLIAMLRFRRYQLIEMAAEELCAMLLATESELTNVQLSIEKPGALEGRARSACVEVRRNPQDFDVVERQHDYGIARHVLWTRDAGIAVLSIKPGCSGNPIRDATTRCLFWVLSGEGAVGDRRLLPGAPQVCEHGGSPTIENRGSEPLLVFICEVPAQAESIHV